MKDRTFILIILLAALVAGCLISAYMQGNFEKVRSQNVWKENKTSVTIKGIGVTETKTDIGIKRELKGKTERKAGEKKIALTFDDGPHPYYTEQLLDGLKEQDAKATFFVMGKQAELYPDLITRMEEEGHLIGNHTYSHMQLSQNNREKFKQELIQTNTIIESLTGREVEYVRPPYGSWDKSFESELNMFPVLWTIDPLDWCSSNVSGIVQKVTSKAEENAIILMHDEYKSSITAALEIVDILKEQGYEFVTVEEILFD